MIKLSDMLNPYTMWVLIAGAISQVLFGILFWMYLVPIWQSTLLIVVNVIVLSYIGSIIYKTTGRQTK